MRNFTAGLIQRYGITQPGTGKNAASLSGGNLQKLILAREIMQFRDYIVFSEPCWGLDLTSSIFVRAEITALREKGAAIILISTNLDEILELADRIIVLYRGLIAGTFINNTTSVKEKIGVCMQGLTVNRDRETIPGTDKRNFA
jgi:simple sugar transport system ATP-binding protein